MRSKPKAKLTESSSKNLSERLSDDAVNKSIQSSETVKEIASWTQISLKIPVDVLAQVDAAAKSRFIGRSSFIKQALAEKLERMKREAA